MPFQLHLSHAGWQCSAWSRCSISACGLGDWDSELCVGFIGNGKAPGAGDRGRRGKETWRLQASWQRVVSEEAGKALTSCPR